MRFNARSNRRDEVTVDLTAMLDVAFNLILFFMVTTTFVKQQPQAAPGENDAAGMKVDLPRSSSQQVLSEKKELTIWIALNGEVRVNDQALTMDGLRVALRNAALEDPNTLVIVKADAGVTHGRVVGIMDVARAEGLTRQAIATDPNGGGP